MLTTASYFRPIHTALAALALFALLGLAPVSCLDPDCTETACSDRIRIDLSPSSGVFPAGTYTFTMATNGGPALAAVCSLPSDRPLEDCRASQNRLTLRATSANDHIFIELKAPSGGLGTVASYDISVRLDGKVLIEETMVPQFTASEDVFNACDELTCNEADDSVNLP